MRVHLFRCSSTGELQITGFIVTDGQSWRGKSVWMLKPGQGFHGYSFEMLWELGNGTHDLPPLPAGSEDAERPQTGAATL